LKIRVFADILLKPVCYYPCFKTPERWTTRMARPRVLVLGGGFAGVFTTLGITGSADVTLVSEEDHFLFTPMLYEYLSGEVEEWHIAPKFNELVNENDVRLIRDEVASIDLDARRVTLEKFK